MEIRNPISDLFWLLGDWNGEYENDEGKFESNLHFQKYGREIISYDLTIKANHAFKNIESGYFFFDKTNEKLKHIIINEDGYVEIGSLDLIFDKKFVSIKSFFEQGYNLPPKSIIIREITQVGSKNTIEIYLKLGKSEKIFSQSVYEKTIIS